MDRRRVALPAYDVRSPRASAAGLDRPPPLVPYLASSFSACGRKPIPPSGQVKMRRATDVVDRYRP